MASFYAKNEVIVTTDASGLEGYPEEIVSDNGPQLISHEFEELLRIRNIKLTFSAVNHPEGNSEVEQFNRILGETVQTGYGLFVLEEERRSTAGALYTCGPGTYKIPGFGNIPVQLNVTLLKGASNPRAVYSSKAIGEPPLFLAASVFFAIRHAIAAARADVGLNNFFQLNSPATAEKIRMACADQFTKRVQ
ncbi:hypothetical protein LSAT2_014222 [Lamellibrachia satsuma]|nr:hypothetical protein LSAT2_014222 [Lamellibrachia satsuma]